MIVYRFSLVNESIWLDTPLVRQYTGAATRGTYSGNQRRGHSLTEQGSLITDEMRQCIGEPRTPRVVQVERGAIAVFASAIGDANPLFTNDIHARGTRYGGIITPPTFLRTVSGEGRELFEESGLENVLDGVSEWS